MSNSKENIYSIPDRFRRMENMHIIFWLLKDISWCLFWKPLGIAMIFPTLIIAIVFPTAHDKSNRNYRIILLSFSGYQPTVTG